MRPLLSLDQMARHALERGASDFHLASGLPPVMTVLGNLLASDFARMSPEAIEALARLDEPQRATYRQQGQLTLSYRLEGEVSGRLHILRQRHAMHISARLHPWSPPWLEPSSLQWGTGLWIVAGAGRSTLQCAVAHHLHGQRRDLAVDQAWQEWPWDYPLFSPLTPPKAVIVMDDANGGDRLALVSDLLADGRDLLVTHPGNGYNEVLESLRHHAGEPGYLTLVNHLGGIVCQRLVPSQCGRALVAVREILVGTPVVRQLLIDDKRIQVFNSLQTGSRFGMQTFDQGLLGAIRDGLIDEEVALDYSDCPDDLKRMLYHLRREKPGR